MTFGRCCVSIKDALSVRIRVKIGLSLDPLKWIWKESTLMPYNSFVGEIFPSPRRRGPAISPLSSQTQYLTTLPTQCYGAILALLWNLLRIRAFISLLYQHYQGHYHPVKCKWWHRLRIIWINLESNWFLSSCNGSLSKNAEEFLNNTLQISQWWNGTLEPKGL